MGDKTQLLSLMLVARYKRPWTILAGVFTATLLNHLMAAWLGAWISSFFGDQVLAWLLAILFFAFAIWVLIPDKAEESPLASGIGVFLTTVIAFFLAEMGDKTQVATVALGARYMDVVSVTTGTTLGMLAANALAIFCGQKIIKRISLKWFRIIAATLFALSGAAILLRS